MSLPKGFKQLEYIQSSGTQYVDSKFVPDQDTRVVVDMNVSQSNNQQGLFGARDGSIYFELFTYTATNGYQDDYGSTQKYPVGSINYGRHILDKNKNVFSVDGIAVNTITATTFSISYSVFLLSINKDGSAYAAVPTTAKLYSCQSTTTVLWFVTLSPVRTPMEISGCGMKSTPYSTATQEPERSRLGRNLLRLIRPKR